LRCGASLGCNQDMNARSVSVDPETVVRELVLQAEARITDAEAALAGLAGARALLDQLRDAVAQVTDARANHFERPRLYTVAQAAAALALSESKVVKMVGSGELASVKIGAARRIPAVVIDAYLDGLAA